MARAGFMSRAQSRQMFDRIRATKEDNERALREEAHRRRTCPIEIAKGFLRSRGFHVFAEAVLPGRARSKLIVVGQTPMTDSQVVEKANELRVRMRILNERD